MTRCDRVACNRTLSRFRALEPDSRGKYFYTATDPPGMRRALSLALALGSCALARAGLLFALVDPDVNETQPSFTALISPPNASLANVQGVAASNLVSVEQLVAVGAGRTLYTLAANFSTKTMDLVGIDLISAAEVSHVPTPLPILSVLGDGQYMAYIPSTNEVALVGALAEEEYADWHVFAVAPDSGALRNITSLAGKDFLSLGLGNYAGFSPQSNSFWFQLRNRCM